MIVTEGLDEAQHAMSEGIDPKNYAKDAEKCGRFMSDIVSLFPHIETQRVTLENSWNEYHHVWARKNTSSSRFYTGVNDAYFPIAFSNIETLVAYMSSQLFPDGPKFAIRASNPMVPPAVIQKLTALFEYFIYIAKLELNFTDFVRQGVVFGPTVVKNVWRNETLKVYKPQQQPVMDEMGQPQMSPEDGTPVTQTVPVMDEIIKYRGPTFQVVDMLSLYLYPFDARELDECSMIYEKIDRDLRRIKALEGKAYLNTELLEENTVNVNSSSGERRNTNRNFRTSPYGLSREQVTDPNRVTLNEVWCDFDLYGDGYLVPCKAVVVGKVILELRQNPYWHQHPPYRLWRAIKHMDHIYGMGWMEIGAHHQYTMNAIINQALDANLFQTNQMMAVDADRYQGRLSDIEVTPLNVLPFSGPGAVEDAIKFFKPDNTAAEAFAVANIVAGNLQDSFGTPPVIQGKFTNKERTATEVNAVAQGASVRIDVMVRNLALTIMQTWLEDSFALSQQFCPDDLDFKATGMPPIHLNRNDVLQEPFFQWLTSAESDKYMAMMQQQQQQQAMAENTLQSGQPGVEGAQTPSGASEGLGTGSTAVPSSFGNESGM